MLFADVLSAGLDAGVAIGAIVIYFCFQYPRGGRLGAHTVQSWWGNTVMARTADFAGPALSAAPPGSTFGCVASSSVRGEAAALLKATQPRRLRVRNAHDELWKRSRFREWPTSCCDTLAEESNCQYLAARVPLISIQYPSDVGTTGGS